MIAPVAELEKCLAKLPGFGRRSASRAALALVREPARLAEPLVAALRAAHDSVRCCSRCGAFTTIDRDPCDMCTDATRDGTVICVVEEPADIVSIEASGAFRGRYHALGGKLSPAHRMGPERLRISELVARVREEGVSEVLLALSTDMDGDATAGFITEVLKGVTSRRDGGSPSHGDSDGGSPSHGDSDWESTTLAPASRLGLRPRRIWHPAGVKVTRLAFGLPADSGIAYSDPLTLKRAIAGRREA